MTTSLPLTYPLTLLDYSVPRNSTLPCSLRHVCSHTSHPSSTKQSCTSRFDTTNHFQSHPYFPTTQPFPNRIPTFRRLKPSQAHSLRLATSSPHTPIRRLKSCQILSLDGPTPIAPLRLVITLHSAPHPFRRAISQLPHSALFDEPFPLCAESFPNDEPRLLDSGPVSPTHSTSTIRHSSSRFDTPLLPHSDPTSHHISPRADIPPPLQSPRHLTTPPLGPTCHQHPAALLPMSTIRAFSYLSSPHLIKGVTHGN